MWALLYRDSGYMSKSRTLFFALFCIFLQVLGQRVSLSGKKPNILEKLLQIVAGEPIGGYNPSISKIAHAFW
jgi:hypothetical protein